MKCSPCPAALQTLAFQRTNGSLTKVGISEQLPLGSTFLKCLVMSAGGIQPRFRAPVAPSLANGLWSPRYGGARGSAAVLTVARVTRVCSGRAKPSRITPSCAN